MKGSDVVWLGEPEWSVQHGPAMSRWRMGLVVNMSSVITPDGRRDDVVRSEPGSGLWCYRSVQGIWKHGEIEYREDDIEFLPLAAPLADRSWNDASMAADLLAHRPVSEIAADRDMAERLYGALCQNLWSSNAGRQAVYTWRTAAILVSKLRGFDEPSSEYLYCGTEGDTFDDRIVSVLRGAGWNLERPVDSSADLRLRAERLVRSCEGKPPSATPDWFGDHVSALHPSVELKNMEDRLMRASFSGKVTAEEWDMFWQFKTSASEH